MITEQAEVNTAAINTEIQHFFSRRLLRLESRVESMEAKVVSLGKVVRLLQQYSEKKDQQYEKEANNFSLLHSKLTKIEEMEAQLINTVRRCDQIANNAHNHSLRLEQTNRAFMEKQNALKQVEDKLGYEIQEIARKVQRIQNGLLQQLRDEGRKQTDSAIKPIQSYNIDQLHFKMAQLEQAHKTDYDKLRAKLDKIIKKPQQTEDQYGFIQADQQRQREKSKSKKGNSLLKRVKSK